MPAFKTLANNVYCKVNFWNVESEMPPPPPKCRHECPTLPRSSRRIPHQFFPQTTTVNVEPSSVVCLLISGFTVLITTVEYRHYDFDEQKTALSL